MVTEIYSKDYFNLDHPLNPICIVQLRTDSKGNNDDWEEITFNPNNYFDSLTIEDKGDISGKTLTLQLVDKNLNFMQAKITKALQVAQKLNKGKEAGAGLSYGGNLAYFKAKIILSPNIRVKIGYLNHSNSNIIDSSEEFKTRVSKKKTVGISPWIYGIINNYRENVTQEGLKAEISAISIQSTFLYNLKIVQKKSVIEGTPSAVLDTFKNLLEKLLHNGNDPIDKDFKVLLEGEPPAGFKDENGEEEKIQLFFGDASAEDGSIKYKTVALLLDEFCSKIPPRKFEKGGIIYNFNWFFDEETRELIFKYLDSSKQNIVRVYSWLNTPDSIVKNFNVNTDTLFSALSMPIIVYDKFKTGIYETDSNPVTLFDETVLHVPKKIELSEEQMEEAFVFKVVDTKNANFPISKKRFVAKFQDNLQKQIIPKGTLEIPGDSFFLFDKTLIPAEYYIKFVLVNPSYLNKDGKEQGGEKNYLSGDYLITNISHTIDSSGFSTLLGILKKTEE